jgi:hypothetical protein
VSADVDGGHPRRDMRRHYAALSTSNQFIISSLCLPNATPAFAITIGSAKVVGDGSARAPADNPAALGRRRVGVRVTAYTTKPDVPFERRACEKILPAVTYSPTPLRMQYHRRWQA